MHASLFLTEQPKIHGDLSSRYRPRCHAAICSGHDEITLHFEHPADIIAAGVELAQLGHRLADQLSTEAAVEGFIDSVPAQMASVLPVPF